MPNQDATRTERIPKVHAAMRIDIDHRLYGQHSGFPPCCIEWWINEWDHVPLQEKYAYWNQIHSIEERGPKIEYVPCPACMEARNFVEVHHCDSHCVDFLINRVGMEPHRAFWSVCDNVLSGKVRTPRGYRVIDVKVLRVRSKEK